MIVFNICLLIMVAIIFLTGYLFSEFGMAFTAVSVLTLFSINYHVIIRLALVWQDGKKEKSEVFSFSELDEMRINVQDLIEHPDLYRIDLQEHKIYQSQVGRNAY